MKPIKVDEEQNVKSLIPAPESCTVVPVGRSVLEHKLLAALDDSSKVAILATKDDLDLFIWALEDFRVQGFPRYQERAATFAKDLRQLRREAFGE